MARGWAVLASILLFFLSNILAVHSRGDNIGRILVIEFKAEDAMAFDKIMAVLKCNSGFEMFSMEEKMVISLPGLTIYPEQRKIYRDRQEIHLTVKEYDLLCLLAYNKERVLTYGQLYPKVCGEEPLGRESNVVSCYIRNLCEKFLQASSSTPFAISSLSPFHIKCVREVGTVPLL